MKEFIKNILTKLRIEHKAREIYRKIKSEPKISACLPHFPTYKNDFSDIIIKSGDPIRYSTIAMAIQTIFRENILGDFAEAGVYQGSTSRILHLLAPEKKLYLFDTFEGFPKSDIDREDERFRDTDMEFVKRNIGNLDNIIFKKGYVPATFAGLEKEKFAFVMLDMDIYKPTLASLEFFYSRISRGGYLFAHDYNSPESDYAIKRAFTEFMADKQELLIEIPDKWGSILFRKL